MLQIPLSDLDIEPGRLVEWGLRPPDADPGRRRAASFNQQKHFVAALAAREEHAPERNWVGLTFEIDGALDETALQRALSFFVQRHEVLRCAFERQQGQVRCTTIAAADVVLDRRDLGRFASCEAVRAYLRHRFDETINPLAWPLFLMGAVVRDASATVYMAFDHIVCDGMSLVMAVRDVQAAYDALLRGEPVELPDVGSYLDFGDEQRARYAGLTAQSPELAYWKRFIDGQAGEFFPRMPLDFGVEDQALDYPAANETISLLDDEQATRFEQTCRDAGGRLFMGLLAAVGIALHQVSGAEEYRGLMPIGERKDPRWAPAFGWFVNTMPVAFPVAGRTFPEVLDGVRAAWSELISNIDVPFVKVWQHLAPQYFALRGWPFPVNFFSFIDFRKMPGAANFGRWQPRTIPQASHVNTGNMWLFRNDEGVFLNAIYADTAAGRRSMDAYRHAIRRVLRDLVEVPEPVRATYPLHETSYVSGPADQPLLGDTIGECLARTVARFGDRPALVDAEAGQRWTYAELDEAVDAVALGLIGLGVGRGDRVGILAPNRAEWVFVQYATAKIGAILVTVNPTYRSHELGYAVNQSGMRVLISASRHRDTDYRQLVDGVRASCPALTDVVHLDDAGWDQLLRRGYRADRAALTAGAAALTADDPINIQYTSGTTGFPKGATLSHHNILNNGFFVGERLHYTEHDRICVPVPLYHCFGMVMGNLAALTHGSCVVLPGASFHAAETLRVVARERCTSLYGVPTMFIAELAAPEFAEHDLTSLRTGIMAGAPCPAEVMRRVVEEMHMRDVAICYGMTETSPVSTMTRTDDTLVRRTTTTGSVMPHLEIKIADPGTGRPVARSVPGELCTRGYSVMLGYWNEPERTAETITPARWLHSGDLATMDEEGYVSIVGRIKDMVIRGGENIYPREIEEFLHGHPDIEDVQVVGVPDARYGEELIAWVKLRPGAGTLTVEQLRSYCSGKLAHYKIPRYLQLTDAFPLTVSGKPRKGELRQRSIDLLGLLEDTVRWG